MVVAPPPRPAAEKPSRVSRSPAAVPVPLPEVVVLVAHPQLEHSRVNRLLMQHAARLPQVEVRDLYALYPDYLIDVPADARPDVRRP